MFEKEAEEYVNEHSEYNETFDMVFVNCDTKKAFKDGAEFGYNKGKSEAKELIESIIRVTWGEGWNYSLDWKVKAEQFLKEVEDGN